MSNDLKLSLRQLGRTPGFTADRPFRDPDALVQLYSRKTNEPDSYRQFSYPAFRELAALPEAFEGVMAHQITAVGVRDGSENTRRVLASLVSAGCIVMGTTV